MHREIHTACSERNPPKGDQNRNRHVKDQVCLCTKHKSVNRSILASANVLNQIVCVCARQSPVKSSSYCRADPPFGLPVS